MERLGLVVNIKKIFLYWLLMLLGLSMMFNGIVSFRVYQIEHSSKLSDEEIIERAKNLGMVDIKTLINAKEQEESSQDEETIDQ